MLDRLNDAMQYIEDHLTEEIDMKEVARLACCSEHHFTRMFSYLSGTSLSEYIRRRRLTLAAVELYAGRAKVIDIALKYGYGSPDAFTRAFHAMHGMPPSETRQLGKYMTAYPRLTFQLTIQGGNEMKVRIVEQDEFNIVGLMKRVPIQFEGVNPEIAAMWQSLTPDMIVMLKSISDIEPRGMISASANFSEGRMEEKGELDHYIGVATTQACPEQFAQLKVGASTWAVFEAVGPFPSTLQNIWGRIYSEWFPSSQYEQAEGPEILWNEHPDTSLPTYRSEIWIPVKLRR